ncbi:hypothetical protein JL100_036500 (plasmid) [Skermanella mucosa]|uniref:hypothetical protein n=1 Tax=Skermanella mucosa TaxID=1789672 RepID=UPI00192BCEF8|nr:hypothetical protein [Skermanella mucosa]UEM25421.1 hypothetical protein JL100_036500 [Skermanella mucosa]
MNNKNSLEHQESQVSERIFPDLKEHLEYVTAAYNLAFEINKAFDGKLLSDMTDPMRAQIMILMRVTDFLRSAQLLCFKGYPEQAGSLVASIFEQAHTALFFFLRS